MGARGSPVWWKDVCYLDLGRLEDSSEYSLKDVYNSFIPECSNEIRRPWLKIWNKVILSKVSCLVWSMVQNRISTNYNIDRRGIVRQGQDSCIRDYGSEDRYLIFFSSVDILQAHGVACAIGLEYQHSYTTLVTV